MLCDTCGGGLSSVFKERKARRFHVDAPHREEERFHDDDGGG